jgi:hypothetical protein
MPHPASIFRKSAFHHSRARWVDRVARSLDLGIALDLALREGSLPVEQIG